MSKQPLVSVICLCYNHSQFIIEALNSVSTQDYKPIEIIIVDDFSTDNSVNIISKWLETNDAVFIKNNSNLGNTTSFNKALKLANGEYIVDFATDDVLTTNSISERIKTFQSSNYKNLGVVYSNVALINESGDLISHEYKTDSNGKTISKPKTGNIYKDLVSDYFISASSMLIKKNVFDNIGGYDEDLAYEDLDFWFRSSRIFEYDYTDNILVKKRVTANSLGSKFYLFGKNSLSKSTFKVCKKAFKLNKNKEEDKALLNRLKYEIKLALKNLDVLMLFKFSSLWATTYFRFFRKK